MPKDEVDIYNIMRDTASPEEAIEWNNTELKALKRKQYKFNSKTKEFRNDHNDILDREGAYRENAKVKGEAFRLLKDPKKTHKFMTTAQDDGEGEFEKILTRIQKGDASQVTKEFRKVLTESSYVVPYSKPLMSETERRNLDQEINEIRFKAMTNPEPDPDLSKGIAGLLNAKKLK